MSPHGTPATLSPVDSQTSTSSGMLTSLAGLAVSTAGICMLPMDGGVLSSTIISTGATLAGAGWSQMRGEKQLKQYKEAADIRLNEAQCETEYALEAFSKSEKTRVTSEMMLKKAQLEVSESEKAREVSEMMFQKAQLKVEKVQYEVEKLRTSLADAENARAVLEIRVKKAISEAELTRKSLSEAVKARVESEIRVKDFQSKAKIAWVESNKEVKKFKSEAENALRGEAVTRRKLIAAESEIEELRNNYSYVIFLAVSGAALSFYMYWRFRNLKQQLKVAEEIVKKSESLLCVVCQKVQRTHLSMPCSHFPCCEACRPQFVQSKRAISQATAENISNVL